MTVLVLKLLVTQFLMLSISLAARRWGAQIGGLLSGLPVTSALIMLFLGVEQGTSFAAAAVPGALAAVAAIQATYLFYFLITRHVSVPTGCVMALACYAASALLISSLGSQLMAIAITLLMVAAILRVAPTREASDQGRYIPLPRWIIPFRMLTTALLLLAITASAEWLGPVASGILAPIPVIAWPLAVFTHVQGGRHELAEIVRGNAIGGVGVVSFYLTLKYTVLTSGIFVSVAAAVLIAVLVTCSLAAVLRKRV